MNEQNMTPKEALRFAVIDLVHFAVGAAIIGVVFYALLYGIGYTLAHHIQEICAMVKTPPISQPVLKLKADI